MVEAPTLDAVRSALAPVEELRGEQSQLETWVRESFATLESLHDELSEWQRELARQQADFDERTTGAWDAGNAWGENAAVAAGGGAVVEELQDRLARSQDALRQLEEENGEQLGALGDLDRQFAATQSELRVTRKRGDELSAALDAERQRALEQERLWAGELRELRRLLENHGAMLVSLGASLPVEDDESADLAAEDADDPASSEAAARAAELRRRAATRRVQRRTA